MQKIAIVKLSAMGDIIHTMVALQFIKNKFPKSQIDWIVEDGFKSILENNPHIDNILPINLKSIKQNKSELFNQIKLVNLYAKNNYDIVIDAQGLIKSAIVSKILGGRVVNSFIAGFDKDSIRESIASWFYDKKTYIPYEKNVIDRNIKVISDALNMKISKQDILSKKSFLFSKKELDNIYKDYIVFVVGASKLNKIYPKEKFLEIAQRIGEKCLVVWGNKDEYDDALWLSKQSDFIEIAPKGDLDDLKFLIKNSKCVIGGDTGPTHMGWALNVPSITIFGNTPEYRNTYITKINKVVKSNSIVDPLKLNKNDFTIKDIKAVEIVNILNEIVN